MDAQTLAHALDYFIDRNVFDARCNGAGVRRCGGAVALAFV